MGHKFTTVEEYLASFSGQTKERLLEIREKVLELAPEATERISYNIPGMFIGKIIVIYYSGYANHISIYPGRVGVKVMKELSGYSSGKSTLKFPNNQSLPMDGITNFIQTRITEARE